MVGRQHVHGSRGIWNKGVNPKRKPNVNSPIELDCHLTQKQKRDAARTNPGGQPKLKKPKASKTDRKAENAARKQSREASHNVIVERRVGKKPNLTSLPEKIDLPALCEDQVVQRAAKHVIAILRDIEATEKRLAALRGLLSTAKEKLRIAQNLAKPLQRSTPRKRPKPNRDQK